MVTGVHLLLWLTRLLSQMSSALIDKCSEYITEKDCYYLAKEGYLVYYSSDTGRKSDYTWKKLSIPEVLRIIKATRLSTDAHKLKDHHLVSAFQELERVYEYGTKSRHKVSVGIFNYSEFSETSLADDIMDRLSGELISRGYRAIKMCEVTTIFHKLSDYLGANCPANEARDLMYKHFESLGYVIKTGSKRPLVDKKLTPVLMQPMTKPSDVTKISVIVALEIVNKIIKELK
jgi:tRNA splicing endonuclease